MSGRMRDLFTNWSHGQRFEEAAKSFTGTLEKLAMDYGLKTLEGHQREVLAERKRVLGAEHPDTLVAADNLARTLADQGKRAEAEEIEREAPSTKTSCLPRTLPSTLPMIAKETGDAVGDKSLEKLAMDYGLKTLEGQQREVLAERKRVLGAEHPDTLVAADNLARTLEDQGKRAEAEEIEREVLAVRKRVLGAETG